MSALRHVPNVLTALRLVAAPATAGFLVAGHFQTAFGIFAFAGLSDAADGFLAKRFDLSSRLGRILDPAADKTLMLAVFATLALLGEVPVWVAAIVIGRDFIIVLGLLVALAVRAPVVMKPLIVGKLSTALQVIYIGIHMAALAFEFPVDAIVPLDAYVLAAIAIASLLAYIDMWLKLLRGSSAEAGRRA